MVLVLGAPLPGVDAHSRADAIAIALAPNQPKRDPVIRWRRVVAQQRRTIVHVDDERVDVAIVVVVAERGAAARLLLQQPAANLGACVPEAGALVHEHLLALLIARAESMFVDLGIDVPVRDEDVDFLVRSEARVALVARRVVVIPVAVIRKWASKWEIIATVFLCLNLARKRMYMFVVRHGVVECDRVEREIRAL